MLVVVVVLSGVVQVARDTHGFVGADIAQLCMEAALACIAEKVNSGRTTIWISILPRDIVYHTNMFLLLCKALLIFRRC